MELERKTGGNFPLKLHNESRPIAYKYREGEMKRTLERELKVPEIAEGEAIETRMLPQDCHRECEAISRPLWVVGPGASASWGVSSGYLST